MQIKQCLRAFAVAAALGALPAAAAIDPSYSGSWYRPSESGSGFNLEIFGDDRALLFWYTYNDDGQPVWLYSEGEIAGDTIDFVTYYADGMLFSDLDTADKNNRVWGALVMDFTDCNTATITYDSTLTGVPNSPEGTRVVPVQRLVNIASLPCRRQAAGYWEGRHWDPTLGGGQGAWSDLSGVTTEDGRLFLSSTASEEVFLGTYTVTGDSIAFDHRICEDGGTSCVDASGTAAFASRDFVNGTGTSAPWGTQPFELTYRTVYDRTPALAELAGTWTLEEEGITYTVEISALGDVTGSNSIGCTFDGQLAVIDEHFNGFSYEGTMAGCATDTWSGVVVNTDVKAGDRDELEFRVETEAGAIAFALTRAP